MPESAARVFDRLATTEPPTHTRTLFDRAVVLGGSVAGLLAARVLADHAERVVVVERDERTERAEERRGVPQSAQVHTLLPGGRRQLDRWFEGFSKEAVAEGAVLAKPGRFRAYFNGEEKVDDPTAELITGSRPFLESLVRRRVLALPNVTAARGRATAVDVVDGRAVGVRHTGDDGVEVTEEADFVVDAMGRSSRLGDWLEATGWEKPSMERMPIDINYTTAYFRRSAEPEVVAGISFWDEDERPDGVAPAAFQAVEGGRWMIMFGGYGDDRPGATPEEFRRICDRLPEPFRTAASEEMLGDVRQYKQADSRRRAYHALERFPARLVSVGDAVASFNPIYGQGMTSAALHASCLSEWLRSEPALDAPATGFFALQKVVVDSAWQTSATPDLALPHIGGPYPRGYRVARWVTGQILDATVTDVEVAKRFNAVTFMTAHPNTLATPGTVLRAVRTNLGRRLGRRSSRRAGEPRPDRG
ncbi:FAD-dependent oxidoreductase [Umezawaea sp.]|uniref:FAD-dependent oxidoreductase n=1 Tax=Umezawaea sp. TaxID=1955258 RepID=UPI002ED0F5FB